jgi:hypothetical protein
MICKRSLRSLRVLELLRICASALKSLSCQLFQVQFIAFIEASEGNLSCSYQAQICPWRNLVEGIVWDKMSRIVSELAM